MKYHVVRCPGCRKLSIQTEESFKCENCGPTEFITEMHCLNHSKTEAPALKLLGFVQKHDEKMMRENDNRPKL